MQIHSDHTIGKERFALVVETTHGPVRAWTAVHRQDFLRRIGGARIVVRGQVEEVGHLSSAMTWKCAAAWLPADGEKTIIVSPEGIPPTIEERAWLVGSHLACVAQADPGVIFGPDMNVPEPALDTVANGAVLRDHVTGLTEKQGGSSIDVRGYTAHGLDVALESACRNLDLAPKTASIQGFGAVGAHCGRLLQARGIGVRAVSTRDGAFVAEGDEPLDIDLFYGAWHRGRDAALRDLALAPPAGVRFDEFPEALFRIPVDVFVPSARTMVLAMPDQLEQAQATENPDCQDVQRFLADTGAKIILEGANHPISDAGVEWLESQGVTVLKDFIANCGGLIGCYVEWAYREELRASPEGIEALHDKTLDVISHIVDKNVTALSALDTGVLEGSLEIAKRNRSEMLVEQERAAPHDPDGHAFAKMMMEKLLAE